jgi:beta-carotene hydroxylase
MSKAIVPLDALTAGQRARFRELTSPPQLSWPTAICWVLLTITYCSTYYFCGTGRVPLWVGTLLNALIGYVSFSVIHDSIHRAISSNVRVNDAIGQAAMLLVLPYVDNRLFRWLHILHHRYATGRRDPDRVLHGAWWSLPFRWMAIDLIYFVHAMRHGDKVSRPYLRSALSLGAVTAVVIGVLTAEGYGMQVLMLWFLPSRLILLTLGFSFFWLPHVPHDTTQEENFTRATTIRQGFEWLLGPVLQYQNYHLIHHLYPMTPFYNNYKVWQLLEPELRKKDLAVQHDFHIVPVVYPGASA